MRVFQGLFPSLLLSLITNHEVQSFSPVSPRSQTTTTTVTPSLSWSRPRESAVKPLNDLSGVMSLVNDFFVYQPYAAAALTCGTKAGMADYVAQRRHFLKRRKSKDKKQEADGSDGDQFQVSRSFAFLLYGAMYQGMAQEFIYNHLYPVWFGAGTSIPIVLSKVLFDIMVQTTLVTLPIAYFTKALIFRYSPLEGLRRYWEDITTHGLLKKYWLLWGPVQCATFSIVPDHFRVTFIAVVSFFWLIIFSSVTARPRKSKTTAVVAAAAATAGAAIANGKAQQPVLTLGAEDEESEIDMLAGVEDEECLLVDGVTCNIDG